MTLCPVCRNAVDESASGYCPNCGAALAPADATPTPVDAASTPGDATPTPGDAGGPPPLPLDQAAPPLASAPLSPAAGGPGGPGGGRGRIPWAERDRLGLLTALVETTREVLGSPTRFFRTMPVTGGIGSPLLYAVIVGWIGLVAAALYQAVFRSIVGPSFGAFGGRPELTAALGFAESWGGFIVQAVLGGIFVVIGVLFGAGILHLMLLLLGGARRDFEATLRVVAFAQATSVVFLLPFCGQFVGGVWALVLYVIGLAQAHEISSGKAAAAVFLPILLLCCCCAGIMALFAGAIASVLPNVAQ
jgi:hypothetical protein